MNAARCHVLVPLCSFNEELEEFYRHNINQAFGWGSYVFITTQLPLAVTAAILYFGGEQVMAGKMNSGDLVSFLLVSNACQWWLITMLVGRDSSGARAHTAVLVFCWRSEICLHPFVGAWRRVSLVF